MSDEGKILARPSQWSSGVRVQSAEEYDRYTDLLARELLATCTPEQLAVTAAQHMMLLDAVSDSNDGLRKTNFALQQLNGALQALSDETAAQLKLEAETSNFLVKNTARIDLPPDFSTTPNLVESVFRAGDGSEKAFYRRTDSRLSEAGGGRCAGKGVVPAAWLQ